MYLFFMTSLSQNINQLKNKGYTTIPNVISKKECLFLKGELENLFKELKKNPYFIDEGSKKGQIIIRDLPLRKPKTYLKYISLSKILKILDKIFKDKFILDNMMASNSINVNKRFNRKVHTDSQLPINSYDLTTDVVVMISIDDFKVSNGATKVWPYSHQSGIRIHQQNKKKPSKNFHYLKASKGSASILLGQTWHQVGENISQDSRWSFFLHYKRWWMKSSTDFTKCGNKIFKILSNKQKELFGFTSISPVYDFKKKTKKIYTLRKIKSLNKNYFKIFA